MKTNLFSRLLISPLSQNPLHRLLLRLLSRLSQSHRVRRDLPFVLTNQKPLLLFHQQKTLSIFSTVLFPGKCLFLSGLIPRPMNADNDRELIGLGIGFTNIVERTTRASQELTRQEIEEGEPSSSSPSSLLSPFQSSPQPTTF